MVSWSSFPLDKYHYIIPHIITQFEIVGYYLSWSATIMCILLINDVFQQLIMLGFFNIAWIIFWENSLLIDNYTKVFGNQAQSFP